MRLSKTVILWGLVLMVLVGCTPSEKITPNQQVESTTLPSPQPDKAMMVGKIISLETGSPLTNVPVRLASVYRQGNDGAFVLDVSHSPGNFSQSDGNFVIEDINPGEYLIVVGEPENNNYVIFQDEDKKPVSYQLEANKVLEVGTLKVDYKP